MNTIFKVFYIILCLVIILSISIYLSQMKLGEISNISATTSAIKPKKDCKCDDPNIEGMVCSRGGNRA